MMRSKKLTQEHPKGGHILPSVLWKYSKEGGTLTARELEHLKECQDCVATYILSRTCKSLQQIKTKLREVNALMKRTA